MNRLACLTAAIAAVIVGGCNTTASAPQEPPGTPRALNPAEVASVQKGVKGQLKDPESARFGAVYAAENAKGTISVCGYVNAKNSFGGYTGEQIFYGNLAKADKISVFLPIGVGGDSVAQQVMRKMCRDVGVSV
ncbi:hypothetical protein ACWIGM_05360 [Bosea sp. NPDC055332]